MRRYGAVSNSNCLFENALGPLVLDGSSEAGRRKQDAVRLASMKDTIHNAIARNSTAREEINGCAEQLRRRLQD
jgi:hypothetical protein